jgi:hypothetical protein
LNSKPNAALSGAIPSPTARLIPAPAPAPAATSTTSLSAIFAAGEAPSLTACEINPRPSCVATVLNAFAIRIGAGRPVATAPPSIVVKGFVSKSKAADFVPKKDSGATVSTILS